MCECGLTVAVHVRLQIINHLSFPLQVRMSLVELLSDQTHTALTQHLMNTLAQRGQTETLTDAPPASSSTATTVREEKQSSETLTDEDVCSSHTVSDDHSTLTISVQSESRLPVGGTYNDLRRQMIGRLGEVDG